MNKKMGGNMKKETVTIEMDKQQFLWFFEELISGEEIKEKIASLYLKSIEFMAQDGCLYLNERSPKEWVQSLIFNSTVISEGDEEFPEILKLYKENGCIGFESPIQGLIMAVDNEENPTMFLEVY